MIPSVEERETKSAQIEYPYCVNCEWRPNLPRLPECVDIYGLESMP